MRILLTSNPLVGHWLPMLPLARAAQAAGTRSLSPRARTSSPTSSSVASRRGRWVLSSRPSRPACGTVPEQPLRATRIRTVADGMAMFADPAVARAHDLLDRTADWRPNIVVREIYELAGMYVPADLHVLHGLGAHYPNFLALAQLGLDRVRSSLGDPAWRVPMADTPYLDPFPAVLQAPDDQPFTDVIRIRPDAGEVRPGDVLPERVIALPVRANRLSDLGNRVQRRRRVCGTAGCAPGPASERGPDLRLSEPSRRRSNHCRPTWPSNSTCRRRCCCHGAVRSCAMPAPAPSSVRWRTGCRWCACRVARTSSETQCRSHASALASLLLPDQVSAETIRDATRSVLDDDSYAAAAASVKTEIERLPGPSAVVEELVRRAS